VADATAEWHVLSVHKTGDSGDANRSILVFDVATRNHLRTSKRPERAFSRRLEAVRISKFEQPRISRDEISGQTQAPTKEKQRDLKRTAIALANGTATRINRWKRRDHPQDGSRYDIELRRTTSALVGKRPGNPF
jgi:hypothetical protein